MTEWSQSGPTGCDEPHNRRRYGDLDVAHQRSRAVIGESYNFPAAAVALRAVGAAARRPLYAAPAVGVWVTTRPVPRASRPVWVGSPGRRRARCRWWRSSAHGLGDGATAGQRLPLCPRMRAALKLLFGPAKTAGG